MKLHHAGIIVPDLEKAIHFYRGLLGMELVKQAAMKEPSPVFDAITGLVNAVAKFGLLRGDGFYLEIFEYQKPEYSGDTLCDPHPSRLNANALGIRHLCLQTDDVARALTRLLDLGGSSLGETRKVPNGGTAVYCRDPFGNIIEFTAPGGLFPSL